KATSSRSLEHQPATGNCVLPEGGIGATLETAGQVIGRYLSQRLDRQSPSLRCPNTPEIRPDSCCSSGRTPRLLPTIPSPQDLWRPPTTRSKPCNARLMDIEILNSSPSRSMPLTP